MIFQEFTTYLALYDGYVTRLSTANERGHEYFCLLLKPRNAKGWRLTRDDALEQLSDAIDRGAEPGEIRIKIKQDA